MRNNRRNRVTSFVLLASLIIFGGSLVISEQATAQNPMPKAATQDGANGLYVATFTTPQGRIKVNLTDDLAAGDTISGTVETEPAGKNDAERAQNETELNGYVVELEGQRTKVGDKKITCIIPTTLTPEAKTVVLLHNGQTVATTQIPISATAPPTPNTFTLPTGGQQGRPIEIKGPCDGTFGPNDSVRVGATILPPVAESPRSLVLLNTSDVVGPTNLDCNENGVATQGPFRNIGIQLSAPKLNLLRGQTTTLHVVVLGLAGIEQDVPLDLENNSPTVITMSGGEVQHLVIHPAEVQRNGTYGIDRTLTGIMSGAFVVNGTVFWTYTYNRDVSGGGPQPPLPGRPVISGPPDKTGLNFLSISTDGQEFDENGKKTKDYPSLPFSDDVQNPCKKQNCPKLKVTKKGQVYCQAMDNCGGKDCLSAGCHMLVAWANPKDPKIPKGLKDPEKWRSTTGGVAPKDIPKDKDPDSYAIKPETGKVYGCGCH
jgi:hypothetical protein